MIDIARRPLLALTVSVVLGLMAFTAGPARSALLPTPGSTSPFGPGESFAVFLPGNNSIAEVETVVLADRGLRFTVNYQVLSGCDPACTIYLRDWATLVPYEELATPGSTGTFSYLMESDHLYLGWARLGLNSSASVLFTAIVSSPTVVPLPAAAALFASGLVGLGWLRRRRRAATA